MTVLCDLLIYLLIIGGLAACTPLLMLLLYAVLWLHPKTRQMMKEA